MAPVSDPPAGKAEKVLFSVAYTQTCPSGSAGATGRRREALYTTQSPIGRCTEPGLPWGLAAGTPLAWLTGQYRSTK